MNGWTRLSGVLLAGVAALAGDGVRGPVAGYVFDAPRGEIRSIHGIPGASMLGEALPIGVAMARCEVQSPKRFAVCIGSEGTSWQVIRWQESGAVSVANAPMIPRDVVRILFSANGEAAIMQTAAGDGTMGYLLWLRGLPDAPVVAGKLEAGLGWRLLDMDTDGERVLATDGLQLLRLSPANGEERLAGGVKISAAAFAKDGSIHFADAGTSEVWQLKNAEPGAEAIRLLGAEDSVENPVAMGFCGKGDGGRVVVVADAGPPQVVILDPMDRRMERISLFTRPNRFTLLDDGEVYALNEAGASPLLLLDCSVGSAFFVPLD